MCDTVVVVRRGEVLFAKNSDRDPNEAQLLEWHPRREHATGSMLSCTWIAVPQVRTTWATLLSRPYWMWGAEMGANEHGVVIGNEAVFTNRPMQPTGLLGMDLVRLGLERAQTAEEAVDVICALLQKFGQGGRCGYDDASFAYHNSFLVADASGAWVLETAAREYARERVSEGVRAISNGLTIQSFAQTRSDRLRSAVSRCTTRRARVETVAREASCARDMAAALRDHGAETAAPLYHPISGAMSAPCMHAGGLIANSQTVSSFISHLSTAGAKHFATGTAAPCLSGFKPVDVAAPVDVGAPTGVYDDQSVWWHFEQLHRELVRDPERAQRYLTQRDAWERASWEGTREAKTAFDEWRTFVDRAASEIGTSTRDVRPWITRRYWAQREVDARAATPKLPRW
jgi:secernin